MLPSDPTMLLSVINLKLRDMYFSLDSLCEDLDISPEDIKSKLATIGYTYDVNTNQFK